MPPIRTAPSASDPALARFTQLFGPEFGHGRPLDCAPTREALARLGNPQDRLAPIIHVAGTNAKGSTIAFMRAIAEAAGLRVHAFTKPHLFCLNERFIVASETIRDDALIDMAETVAEIGTPLTQFDAQVAAAFVLFSETPADLVLIEAGMGGRDDSTNVISNPAATIITPVGLDHQDALGPRLADIAAHKAGVLKRGVPAIVARQAQDAREVIEAAAATTGAFLHMQGIDWDAYAAFGRLAVETESETLDLPLPALTGAHQIDNAGLAIAALVLGDFPIPDEAFAAGVAGARSPARLQALTRGPFSAPIRALGGEVWVDGGHNAHAARALAHALGAMNPKRAVTIIAIIGLRARKDGDAFLRALAPVLDRVIAVPLSQAHIAPDDLAARATALGVKASAAPSLGAAMEDAARSPAPRVLICGSFLLAADALLAEGVS